MAWIEELPRPLVRRDSVRVSRRGPASSEPTALAALALAAAHRDPPAAAALDWLAGLQGADGSIGPTAAQAAPGWPTSLAVLAGLIREAASRGRAARRRPAIRHRSRGSLDSANPRRSPAANSRIGTRYDARRLALGRSDAFLDRADRDARRRAQGGRPRRSSPHPRSHTAADRSSLAQRRLQLWQYDRHGPNSAPHLQPTGLAVLALAGETDRDVRIKNRSTIWRRSLPPTHCGGVVVLWLMGLAAHDRLLASRIGVAGTRLSPHDGPRRRAVSTDLLALAALGAESPLLTLPQRPDEARIPANSALRRGNLLDGIERQARRI